MKTIEKLIDLVEKTKPKCTLGIDTEVYFKDEDGVIESYGCELTLCWYNQDYELMVTAPFAHHIKTIMTLKRLSSEEVFSIASITPTLIR